MHNNLKNSSDLRYQYIDLLLELNRLDIIKFLIDSNLFKEDDELFQNKLKRSYPKSSPNHFTINNLNIINNNNNNNNTINEQKLNTHTITTTTTITKFPLFKFILKKTKN
ncbi:hypothetical protein ACTFIW_009378 [Dictyostelium discoideum]